VSDQQSFDTLLRNLRGGDVSVQLTEELDRMHTAMLEMVNEHHAEAKGSITLKLNFKTDPKGVVHIDPDITSKLPRPKPGTAVRWLSSSGFAEHDPAQQSLPLRGVPSIEHREERP